MSSTTNGPDDDRCSALVTPRAALILLLAVLAGLGAGGLTLWAGEHVAHAILAGVGAMAAGAAFFNWIIGAR